jgi:DNA-binding NtrC family response regulator
VMRHMNPNAVTILLSANPDMAKAAAAIRQQTDEILRKPVMVGDMVEVIRKRLSQSVPRPHVALAEEEAS